MLFKILHGDASRISTDITPFHEGYCYVTHDGYMYVDMNIGTDEAPNNQRVKLNAKEAEALTGYSVETILNSSDTEIPTSKAVLDAIESIPPTIIDVETLPTENIDTSVIYRTKESTMLTMYLGRQDISDIYPIIVVDELPSVGVSPKLEGEILMMTLYFLTTDQTLYAYCDASSAETFGFPEGWSTFESIMGVPPTFVSSIDEIPEDDTEGCYVLTTTSKPSLFTHYDNGNTVEQMKIITKNDFGGIIYATEKPSTPEQAIYVITENEVVSVDVYQDGVLLTDEQGYCEIVDALPDEPTLAVDLTTQYVYAYYLTTEKVIKAYFDEAVSNAILGATITGWLDMGTPFASADDISGSGSEGVAHTQPKTRVYVPMQDGAFLELTSGIRTRFDENSGTVSITEM